MLMTFDEEGNRNLTTSAIADYFGISFKEVSNIRRKVIKTLRKDAKINTYKG